MGRIFASALCAAMALPTAAKAQAAETYRAAGVIATNIRGVTTFAPTPQSFDALHATDAARAAYGLPPRPDPQAAPDAWRRWARAMSLAARKAQEPLRDMHIAAGPAIHRGGLEKAMAGQPAVAATPNWSAIVNGLPNVHSWNPISSVSYVVAEFNVPVAQQAFSGTGGRICDGGDDIEVSWAGIDGFYSGDVLQGGSMSTAFCQSGNASAGYCVWAEWYPMTPILCEIDEVGAGDDIYVEVWDTDPANGYVYLLDETRGLYTTIHLQATVPTLIGNSAEYVVERPSVSVSDPWNLYPLANYVTNFWGGAFAYRFGAEANKLPTQQFPGSHNSDTVIVNMLNNAGTETISSATAAGPYGLVFQDSGCAFMGGC